MTGGLLQIVTSGKQDFYLTTKPEITFFKKVYKRHINFSIELKEILPEQDINYNSLISFNINHADALHRCYLEIELPYLSFSDNLITNSTYIASKQLKLNNLQLKKNKWNNYYTNLQNFINIELQLYIIINNLLIINNININIIINDTINFNYINKNVKDKYKNNIDPFVLNLIDITSYILNNINNTTTNNIILDNINLKYNNMVNYLSYYNRKINYYNKLINKLTQENQINFNFAEYLGHNFFQYFILEIGGQELEKYSNEFLHIHQMHSIKEDYINNYFEMIGHTDDLNKYNNNPKGNKKIIVPLIFYFNRDSGLSLPIVAMQYSTIKISTKLNDIKNIICFADYEYIYNDIIDLYLENDNDFILDSNYIINDQLLYKKFNIDIYNKIIHYECLYINNELLIKKFPDITNTEINYILTNYGLLYDESFILNINKNYKFTNQLDYYLIDKYHWIKFMININSYSQLYNSYNISSYYPFIDYNLYYSLIDIPQIKLIGEFIYYDDLERGKFADSKLEYIVEIYNENIYNIQKSTYECDINIDIPCKELLWYIKPNLFINSINKFGQNLNLLFNISKYFSNKLITYQNISIENNVILIDQVDDNYYTYLLSYKYLNNILPNDIYYYSFCLYPEEMQPSGTINFKYIKGKKYSIIINKDFINEYNNLLNLLYSDNSNQGYTLKILSKCYNLLVINKGTANLLFSNY